jgi:quercetin dioxygenase-like cupin family protein
MRLSIFALTLVLAVSVPALAQPDPNPDVTCVTLSHRHALPDVPGMTFRVLKLTIRKIGATHMHKHKFGEIVYLLAGSGTNTMNSKSKMLSADSAIVIPPRTNHVISPLPHGSVTILAVQFTDKAAPAWQPRDFKGPNSCRD